MEAQTVSPDLPPAAVARTSPAAAAPAPLSGQTVTPWLLVVLAVIALLGRAVRLRPGCDLRRAAWHQGDLLAQPAAGRGGDELGHARRAVGRSRRRRAGGPDRAQAHRADRGCDVHAGRPRAGARTRHRRPGGGATDRRRRRWRRRRRRTAVCRRAGADDLARPLRLRLPARHRRGHLPRLSGRWLAVEQRCLADHAGGVRRAGAAAVRGGAGGAEIAALADEDGPPCRRCRGAAQDPAGRRRQAAPRCHRDRVAPGGRPAPPGARCFVANGGVR